MFRSCKNSMIYSRFSRFPILFLVFRTYLAEYWSEFLETTWKRRKLNTFETLYIASLMFVLSENQKNECFVGYTIFGNNTRILEYRSNKRIFLWDYLSSCVGYTTSVRTPISDGFVCEKILTMNAWKQIFLYVVFFSFEWRRFDLSFI